jgi:hypothetical protein
LNAVGLRFKMMRKRVSKRVNTTFDINQTSLNEASKILTIYDFCVCFYAFVPLDLFLFFSVCI